MPDTKKQLLGLKLKQQVLYILIFSLVTVMVWVGASLLFSQKRTGISPELLQLAKKLNPSLDIETLEEIENKKLYQAGELQDFPIYKIIKSKDGRQAQMVTIDDEETTLEKTVRAENFLPQPSTASAAATSSANL